MAINRNQLLDFLRGHGCGGPDSGLEWAINLSDYTPEQLWKACTNPGWLLRFCFYCDIRVFEHGQSIDEIRATLTWRQVERAMERMLEERRGILRMNGYQFVNRDHQAFVIFPNGKTMTKPIAYVQCLAWQHFTGLLTDQAVEKWWVDVQEHPDS